MPRSRLYDVIALGVLMICTQAVAQSEDEQNFYKLYPDLRTHKEVVQQAYEQVKQSAFPKTIVEANREVLFRAYWLLNQSTGAKMPYRHILDLYNDARSEGRGVTTLPEFARKMNDATRSSVFDEGLNDNWLRRVGANIDTSFFNSWGFVILVAVLGLISVLVVFRLTARTPTPGTGQQDQPRPIGESVWHRAMRPAGIAAKWGSLCGMLSVFMSRQHLSLIEWVGLALLFSVAVALVISVPVYLIALLCYATRVGSQKVITRE